MDKEQLSQELLNKITAKAESTIREVISAALTEEIGRALAAALTEGEFYRAISADLQEGLKSIYREINAAAGNQPSTGGQIQADPATNSLIISAPEPVYRELRAVIDKLDQRRAQVFIESLIAEVNMDRAADFGVQ